MKNSGILPLLAAAAHRLAVLLRSLSCAHGPSSLACTLRRRRAPVSGAFRPALFCEMHQLPTGGKGAGGPRARAQGPAAIHPHEARPARFLPSLFSPAGVMADPSGYGHQVRGRARGYFEGFGACPGQRTAASLPACLAVDALAV